MSILRLATTLWIAVFGVIWAPCPAAFAQQGFGDNILGDSPFGGSGAEDKALVSIDVIPERTTVSPGSELRLAIIVEVEKEWHIYHDELGPPDAIGAPTQITLKAKDMTFSKVKFPEPEKYDQPGLGADGADTWIYVHHGKFTLYALAKVAGDALEEDDASGKRSLEVKLNGLACKLSCIPVDAEETLEIALGEEPSEPQKPEVFKGFPQDLKVEPTGADSTDPGASDPDGAVTFDVSAFSKYAARTKEESRSFLAYILLGLLAGFLLNFMPCVLPVISIKILSFVQQAGEDRRRVFRLGLTFSAGILVVFLVLASLAAFAGQSWGDQFQSQTFLVVMIGIVFGFSLSLFGVFEIGVPQSVAGLGGVQAREGYADAFFKGVMATILATPCSGPFLGSTLAWALVQPRPVIFAVFTAIGLGMALPYTLLTAKPGWLSFLPRPGAWMETFKHIMGFVLLLTVIYLMVSLKQNLILYTVTFLLFVALAAWVYGRYASYRHGKTRRLAVLGIAIATVFVGSHLSFVTFQGLFTTHAGGLAWDDFDPLRLEQLGEDKKNVLVDWTADWCPNCKYVERFVLESEPVRKLLEKKGVVTLKADITHDTPATRVMKALRDQLGTRSIPFLAIFPADSPYEPYVLRDIYSRDDVRAILEALPDGS